MHPVALTPESPEPPHGSVVMRHSLTGTAYQRLFGDGLYHATTGKVLTFAELFKPVGNYAPPTVHLVFEAPQEDE